MQNLFNFSTNRPYWKKNSMDGVFMKKIAKVLSLLMAATVITFCISVVADRQQLNTDIIRLHVVAQSDSQQDQDVKLQVRDAVMQNLQLKMADIQDSLEAEEFLSGHLQELETVANAVLAQCGVDYTASVTLESEAFDTRHYDTFSLPSGVYRSLRIRLGEARGKNWWCVVFPSLCMQASSTQEDMSVFSDTLTDTIERKEGYELRFFLLDWLGNLEKIFFSAEY